MHSNFPTLNLTSPISTNTTSQVNPNSQTLNITPSVFPCSAPIPQPVVSQPISTISPTMTDVKQQNTDQNLKILNAIKLERDEFLSLSPEMQLEVMRFNFNIWNNYFKLLIPIRNQALKEYFQFNDMVNASYLSNYEKTDISNMLLEFVPFFVKETDDGKCLWEKRNRTLTYFKYLENDIKIWESKKTTLMSQLRRIKIREDSNVVVSLPLSSHGQAEYVEKTTQSGPDSKNQVFVSQGTTPSLNHTKMVHNPNPLPFVIPKTLLPYPEDLKEKKRIAETAILDYLKVAQPESCFDENTKVVFHQ